MKKGTVVLAIVLIVCLLGWAYTYQKYKQLAKSWWDISNEQSRTERLLYSRQNSDLPYEGKTDKEVLEMLPPPNSDYIVEYHRDSTYAFFDEIWENLLVDGIDTISIKVFKWNFDHRITNLSKLHIDFVQKDNEWVVFSATQWDPEVVMF